MASIRKRGNRYFVDYHVDGKRVRKSVGTDKKTAERIFQEIQQQLALNKLGIVKGIYSLRQFFDRFSDYCHSNLAARTQVRYKTIIDNFQRYLQQAYPQIKNINHLTQLAIDQYKDFRQKEGVSHRTINAELIVLNMAFRLAVKWGFIDRNPADEVKKIEVSRKETPRFLSEEECKALLSQCDEYLYPIIFTFLNTGLRKGELENLRWRDVDFERRIIKIVPEPGFVPISAQREVPINQKLLEVLLKQKEISKDAEFVFLGKQGKKIPENYLRNGFVTLTRKCAMADVTQSQTLRYTFGARLVEKGLDLISVKKLMGHSEKDTVFIYGDLVKNKAGDWMDQLDF